MTSCADADASVASCSLRKYHGERKPTLEKRYGLLLNNFQDAYPYARTWKRARLLRLLESFNGSTDELRRYLDQKQAEQTHESRQAQRELWKKQYAPDLAAAGFNVNSPLVLDQLEKYHGDVQKVIEVMIKRRAKKEQSRQPTTKVVKPVRMEERERTTYTMTEDDLDHLRQLRAAGIHGNPMKILSVFHRCNQSIEMTQEHLDEERSRRYRQDVTRLEKRIDLAQIHDAYLNLNDRSDWPSNATYVYLDGNNMIFVINRLRQMCLNRARKESEKALGQIAARWNEEMHIPHVHLIFDSTEQLDPIGTITVHSAQPTYSTTDEMILMDIRQRKNEQIIVVTADRALAVQLKREGCLLVKPYQWFAHCLMVLAPDLSKTDYNLNDLVTRFTNVSI